MVATSGNTSTPEGELAVDKNRSKLDAASQQPTLAVGVEEAARMTAHSRCGIYKAIGAAELKSFKRGRRRMILVSELELWINRIALENAR
jgi:hypothetical protein